MHPVKGAGKFDRGKTQVETIRMNEIGSKLR